MTTADGSPSVTLTACTATEKVSDALTVSYPATLAAAAKRHRTGFILRNRRTSAIWMIAGNVDMAHCYRDDSGRWVWEAMQ